MIRSHSGYIARGSRWLDAKRNFTATEKRSQSLHCSPRIGGNDVRLSCSAFNLSRTWLEIGNTKDLRVAIVVSIAHIDLLRSSYKPKKRLGEDIYEKMRGMAYVSLLRVVPDQHRNKPLVHVVSPCVTV